MSNFIGLLTVCLCLIYTSSSHASGVLSRSRILSTNSGSFDVDVNEAYDLVPWLSNDIKLGQVSGVTIDADDNIYLFHRADRVWDETSFTNDEIYTGQSLGPIVEATILVFNSDGKLINQLGQNLFFLPHGITVDNQYNLWVTDVALHQVMKLLPIHSNGTSIVLGEKFVPGNGLNHFCKPTSVAVVSNGDFFVADGYCNSRILKYNSDGKKILEWGRPSSIYPPPGMYDLQIPHALTLAEDRGIICVADRENGRVVCYQISNGDYVTEFSSNVIGSRLFSVAYSSVSDGRLFVVNGRSIDMNVPVQGVVLSPTGKIVGKFGKNLKTPHDLAVLSDGKTIFVVEIGPNKAWKYVKRDCHFDSSDLSKKNLSRNIDYKSVDNVEGLTGAVLVTISCFVFAIGLFIAMLIYSKSRKSGTSDTRRLLSNIDY